MSLHSGLRARFLAWFMARAGGGYERQVSERKTNLFSSLEGSLVEIGSGTGPNLRLLPSGVTVVGLDPNPFMIARFRQEALSGGRNATVVQGEAEAMPFSDGSVDAVLSTLALCSVRELDSSLAEIRRVLKTGGRFVFLEHVAAEEGTMLRLVQDLVRPPWQFVGGGCHPNRDLESRIRETGFREVQVDRFSVPLPVISPHIAGVAVK